MIKDKFRQKFNQPKKMVLSKREINVTKSITVLSPKSTVSNKTESTTVSNKMRPIVSFIIPTIGRTSLWHTISSVEQQNIKKWEAVVCFDGIKPNIQIQIENKFKIINTPFKVGKTGNGGEVRNFAIEHASGEWLAMLDDDDTITPNYIECLLRETKNKPEVDVVIFKMRYKDGKILPPRAPLALLRGLIGISFAIKRSLAKSIKFKNDDFEDHNYLLLAEKVGGKFHFSEHITYLIGS